MTRLKVIKLFTIAAIAVQLIVGLWQVVTFKKYDNNEFDAQFLRPVIFGAWVDLFLALPVFVVSLFFMFSNKVNKGPYVLHLVLQFINMVLVPIIFSIIILQLDK